LGARLVRRARSRMPVPGTVATVDEVTEAVLLLSTVNDVEQELLASSHPVLQASTLKVTVGSDTCTV
jgi:hypothetical protein